MSGQLSCILWVIKGDRNKSHGKIDFLKATGLVSVADSVSYWFLNDVLLRIPFERTLPG